MIEAFRKLIAPIQRRVALMVGRAVIRLIDDSLKCQVVQIDALAGETLSNVERFQQYGYTSVPQSGAEAVFVCVAGNRSHPIVIAVEDRRYRLKGLQAGEVALYDDLGHIIRLGRDGIVIDGAGQDINITGAPRVVVTGGDIVVDGISLKAHRHSGVTPGGGDTDPPIAEA